MKKNYEISPQIINTMGISHKPWGVKNSSSYFIYGNSAIKEFTHNIEKLFDYRKPYHHELPWSSYEFVR
ncbi:hypothetical protein [Photorhabdus luminescens]|uniref:hypothetical protein n=1 Tax=Photorhabdus luminescens TaxID=29488 RepID=UPI001131784B|nr:hypothetical protein [Photorhabdus luminescens]